MDYIDYINCIVKINCSNGFYYKGKVLEVSDNKIKLIDKNKKLIILDCDSFLSIEEVSSNVF